MFENIKIDDITKVAFSAAVSFIFSISYFFITNYFKEKKKKAGRDIWIKFLNSDRYINECVQQYKKIESPKDIWMVAATIIGILLGSFLYIIFIIVTLLLFNIFNGIYSWSLVYPTLFIFSLSFIATIFIKDRIEKRNKDKTLLNISRQIGSWIIFVNWFIFTSLLSAFVLLAITIAQTKNFSLIINNWLYVSVVLLIASIAFSYKNRRDFLEYSRVLLNSKYLYRFPYVRITTKSLEIEGQISEIFDDNLINLDYGRFRRAVEWDTITHLELRKF